MARKSRPIPDDLGDEGVMALPGGASRSNEVLGILAAFLGLGLAVGLFAFDPEDPNATQRWVGPVGRMGVEGLLSSVGAIGYALVAFLVLGLAGSLLAKGRWPSRLASISGLLLALSLLLLFQIVAGDRPILLHSASGAIGRVFLESLVGLVGTAGSALVGLSVAVLSAIGVFDLSIARLFAAIFEGTRRTAVELYGVLDRWRAAKEAERGHEGELWESEREREHELEKKRLEASRALREKLDDKKEEAIQKARARAEQKVLAALAAELVEEAEEADAEDAEPPKEAEDAETEGLEEEEEPKQDQEYEPESDEGGEGDPSDEDQQTSAVEAEAGEDEGDEDLEPELPKWAVPTGSPLSAAFLRRGRTTSAEPEIIESHPERPSPEILEGTAEPERENEAVGRAYELPPIRLLNYDAPSEQPLDPAALRSRATRLEDKLKTYGVEGRVTAIRPGPVVTTYEYQPAPGVKVSKIANLCDDIAMSMEATSVRIIAPIPGKGVVGIELPNDRRESVYLKEIIAHDRFQKSRSLLTLALGKDTEGEAQVLNLAKMPHLLIAGTTGSGKSVSVNAMILSILYKARPDQVKFIMVDPKMLELSLYNDIPHLLLPVVTDPKKASLALQWAVDEMERRYKLLSEAKVRNIDGFNARIGTLAEQRLRLAAGDPPGRHPDPWVDKDLPAELPYIVVLIDEFADLMCVAPRDVEASVQRLAQKARAAGIHLMIATQRPSTDVITGVIKNNFSYRISFRVASRHDSSTIINTPGAENLLGMGDMLLLGDTHPGLQRVHGAYVTEEEVLQVVDFWKAQGKPKYDQEILKPRGEEVDNADVLEEERDGNYERAVQIVVETQKASISALQRRLRVGYNRAARMIEMMERDGIVSAAMGPKGDREVMVRSQTALGA